MGLMKQSKTGQTLRTQRFGIHIEGHVLERVTNNRRKYLTVNDKRKDQSIHVQSVAICRFQRVRLSLPRSRIPIRILCEFSCMSK